jgi:Zn-dependent protease
MRTGMLITAAAGPLSNVLLAVLCTVIWGLAFRLRPEFALLRAAPGRLLAISIELNLVLALFNLLPVPPLDGSRVVDGLIPLRWRPYWEAYMRYGTFVLFAIFFVSDRLMAVPIALAEGTLMKLLAAVAGVG